MSKVLSSSHFLRSGIRSKKNLRQRVFQLDIYMMESIPFLPMPRVFGSSRTAPEVWVIGNHLQKSFLAAVRSILHRGCSPPRCPLSPRSIRGFQLCWSPLPSGAWVLCTGALLFRDSAHEQENPLGTVVVQAHSWVFTKIWKQY